MLRLSRALVDLMRPQVRKMFSVVGVALAHVDRDSGLLPDVPGGVLAEHMPLLSEMNGGPRPLAGRRRFP